VALVIAKTDSAPVVVTDGSLALKVYSASSTYERIAISRVLEDR